MIPANPDTHLVEVNPDSSEGYVLTPIIGWVTEEGRPTPVTISGPNRMLKGTAILFPDGMVHGPGDNYAFESVGNWLDSNPMRERKNPPAEATKQTVAPETSGDVYDIEWTDKTFKSNSFWHYDDGTYEFVFQIDPDTDLPKATKKVVKIKRDEFTAKKKETDVLTVDEIKNADPLPAPEDEVEEEEDLI